MPRTTSKILSFRLDSTVLRTLEEAAERTGLSVHEWAKRAVIRELESGSLLPKVALTSDSIRAELAELRKDLAVATEALLVSAGKASSEQAAKFVKTNMKAE